MDRKISHDALFILFSGIFARCMQFLIIAAIGRSCPITELGLFGLAAAITTPVVMLSNLQLGNVLVADQSETTSFSSYVFIRSITTAASLVLLLLIALILFAFNLSALSLMVCAMSFFKATESVSDIFHHRLRQKDLVAQYAGLVAISSGITGLGFVAALNQFDNASLGLLTVAVISMIRICCVDIPCVYRLTSKPRMTFSVSYSKFIGTLKNVYPLGITSGIIALYFAIPAYQISVFSDTKSVGIYTAVAWIPLASEFVVRALSQAWAPRFGELIGPSNQRAAKITLWASLRTYLIVGSVNCLLMILFGKLLLLTVYGAEIAQFNDLLILLMVAMCCSYAGFVGPYLIANNRYYLLMSSWMVTLVIMAITTSGLVPIFGIYGAAYSLIISNSLRALGLFILCQKISTNAIVTEKTLPLKKAAA
jgi:O-antigen/teichoic acid export membrane protein